MFYYVISDCHGEPTGNFDPNRCNNGGGYFQFRGFTDAYIGTKRFHIEIEDTSCGDFGQRYAAWVKADKVDHKDGSIWYWGVNEVDDSGAYIGDQKNDKAFLKKYGVKLSTLAKIAHREVENEAWYTYHTDEDEQN